MNKAYCEEGIFVGIWLLFTNELLASFVMKKEFD
jgi:hypothetical protein